MKAIVWKVTKLKAKGKGNFHNSKLELVKKFIFPIKKSAYLNKHKKKKLKMLYHIKNIFLIFLSWLFNKNLHKKKFIIIENKIRGDSLIFHAA